MQKTSSSWQLRISPPVSGAGISNSTPMGPTARGNAEEHHQRKWLEILKNLLRAIKTPMGVLIAHLEHNRSEPVDALRHSSRASEVRGSTWHGSLCRTESSFPSEVFHLTEFLQTRHSEPCNRGSLKVAHNSFIFLEETAGVEQKLSQQALYGTVYKELLARPSHTASSEAPSRTRRGTRARRAFLPSSVLVVDSSAVLGNALVLGPPRTKPRRTLHCGRKLACSKAHMLQDHRH